MSSDSANWAYENPGAYQHENDRLITARARVYARACRMLEEWPALAVEPWETHFQHVAAPLSVESYESMLNRAAFAMLALVALDEAEEADPFSGGEAA